MQDAVVFSLPKFLVILVRGRSFRITRLLLILETPISVGTRNRPTAATGGNDEFIIRGTTADEDCFVPPHQGAGAAGAGGGGASLQAAQILSAYLNNALFSGPVRGP